MSAPYEVVVGPLTVWLAPVGTAFPLVNANPPGTWFKLGTNGTKNYDEPGVTVTHNQTIGTFTPAGGTAARKAFRTAESMLIEFALADLTIEQYAKVLNDATVTTIVGPPNTKDIGLLQGLNVTTFALLARGNSPISDSLPAQYQVPVVYQDDSPKPVFSKGGVAMLGCRFAALDDIATGFGKLVDQIA